MSGRLPVPFRTLYPPVTKINPKFVQPPLEANLNLDPHRPASLLSFPHFASFTHHVHLWEALPCHHVRREPLRFCRRHHRWVPSGGHTFTHNLCNTRSSQIQGLELTAADIQVQLSRRRPGQSDLTTPVRRPHSPKDDHRLTHRPIEK